MSWNKNLEVTKPPDTGESPSLGASRIRDFKNAICERLTNWIYSFKTDDTETDEGLKKAPFKAQATAPTQESDKMIVYAKDVNGIPELFCKDKNGVEIQITSNGKIRPIVTAEIADASVTAAKLAANSVETAKIVDANVTAAKLSADAKALDHGGLTGLADDDHNQYLNTARHDTTTRHPVGVLKLATGSYSQQVPTLLNGWVWGPGFSTNYYVHNYQIKVDNLTNVSRMGFQFLDCSGSSGGIPASTSYQDVQVQVGIYTTASGFTRTLYCQWNYHSASKQAIWGVWDKGQKKLVSVLVEEDEGYCKLHPDLKEGQVLVKFKNPEMVIKNANKERVKEKTMAGHILEDMVIIENDIEEIK
jgi:hypothetical protein